MHIERGYRDSGAREALELLAAQARLLVLGPVGAGRTTLLADVAAHEAQHRRVWSCRGHVVGPPSGQPVLHRGAAESLLKAVAEEPTTLLIDDVDLLDSAMTARFLMLVERHAELGLRIVAARRPRLPSPEVAALDAALVARGGALHLGPLHAEGVAAWLMDVRGTDAGAPDVCARTGGWPELVAAELHTGSLADLVGARVATLRAEYQRVLRALSFGLPISTAALAAAAALDADEIDRAVEAAISVGLVHSGTTPEPAVAEALRASAPAADRARIASAATAAPLDVLATAAQHLLAALDRSPEAGVVYELAADIVATSAPATSADLYDAAVRAGRPAADLYGRRVAVALGAGRVEEALALAGHAAEATLERIDDDPALRRSTGAGWAHLGRPGLAADCYLSADDPTLAVLPLLVAGRLDDARAVLTSSSSSADDPARILAEGAMAWADGEAGRALELFGRSARVSEVVGGAEDWPDSPHALAAISAAHWLDDERAARMTGAAVARAVGGGVFAIRHQLLEAWTAIRSGRVDDARQVLEVAAATTGRDAMVASLLRAAVALRGGEPEELPAIHRGALDAYLQCEPDPFAAGLAAELAHLAARVDGDPAGILGPLEDVAHRLGDPPTVAVQLAWARLLVAVAADDGAAAGDAADKLSALAAAPLIRADRTASAPTRLLADAARAFADVLRDDIDADTVRTVAARLVERGLVFEGSRLVGAAGLRCRDAATARALLADLRRLRATQVRTDSAGRRVVAELSEREREVARGVLDGRTHREIGAQLYISAKTVEHHVARIRQKLGAGSRAELLAAIRLELERVG